MPVNQAQRPFFYEGQYLGAEDLTQLLQHERVQDARHMLGGHTWGIALGLNLREQPSPEAPGQVVVTIQPGYAWDGYGRPIVVLSPARLAAERFQSIVFDAAHDATATPGRLVDIWVRYREFETLPPGKGFGLCGVAKQNTRVQETFQIEVGRFGVAARRDNVTIGGISVAPNLAVQRFDPAAPLLFDESVPHQDVPIENPTAWWLVPVGKVRWLPNTDPSLPGSFLPLTGDDSLLSARTRNYIGMVGGSVEALGGLLRLKDRRLAKAATPSDDLVWVEGKLRVNADVRLFSGSVDFRDTNGGADNLPLKIRRTGNALPGQDLQVTIGQMNPANNRFLVGPLDNAGAITPNLTVLDLGNVGIGTEAPAEKLHVVGGKIRWGDSELDPAQGGSIELGGNGNAPGTGTPYIDFHFNGLQQDFNTRIINDADGRLRIEAPVLSASGRLGIGTNAPGEAVEIANNGNLLFKASATDPGDIIFQDSAGTQKARIWSLPQAGPGLLLSSGDNNADMVINGIGNVGVGTTTPQAKLHVAGDLRCDLWTLQQLLSNAAGPLPLITNFTTHGGSLMLFASGSGRAGAAPAQIGMTIIVDGFVRGRAECHANEAVRHMSFVANALVVMGLAAGTHTISLNFLGGTTTDDHDRYSLTAMELPF